MSNVKKLNNYTLEEVHKKKLDTMWSTRDEVVLFVHSVKKIKGVAHKNYAIDGTCKEGFMLYTEDLYINTSLSQQKYNEIVY